MTRVLRRPAPPAEPDPAHFFGSDYDPALDYRRLTNQLYNIWRVMADHQWRTPQEVADITGYAPTSVRTQFQNLRLEKHGAFEVEIRERAGVRGLNEYRVGEKGAGTPKKAPMVLRAEAAERWCRRLAKALEDEDPENPVLLEFRQT